jgi:outer membrane protein assembly factor BamB
MDPPGAARACADCGERATSDVSRWCARCGAVLPAVVPARVTEGVRPSEVTSGSGADPRVEADADPDAAAPAEGTQALAGHRSASRRMVLPLAGTVLLLGGLVFTQGGGRTLTADEDEAGEPPTAATDESAPAGEDDGGPVGHATGCSSDPDCIVWAGPVTTAPLSPTADVEIAAGALVAAERIAPLAEDEIAIEVRAIDLDDGTPRWSTTITAPAAPEAPPSLAVAGSFVLAGDCAQVSALDLADGSVAWQLWFDEPVVLQDVAVAPANDPEVVLVVTATRVAPTLGWIVTAVGIDDGAIRWQRDVARAATTTQAVVVDDGDEVLLGLDPLTGDTRWEVSHASVLRDPRSLAGAVAIDDWSGAAPVTRLLSADDGDPLLPAFVQHDSVAFAGTVSGRGAAIVTTGHHVAFVEDGTIAWTIEQPDSPCCSSSHVDAERVVVQLADGTQRLLDRADGSVRDERDAPAEQDGNTSTLIGRFLVVTDGPLRDRPATLRFLDAADGEPVAVLAESQLVAALPDGDVLVLADGDVTRVTVP